MPAPTSPVSASLPPSLVPPFEAPFAPDDVALARPLLTQGTLAPEAEARIDALAARLITAIRKGSNAGGVGGIEEVLREYALSTKEGLALMTLAEALLRVPDSATADRLIEDKLAQGDFLNHDSRSSALLVNASSWALGVTARVIQPGETPEGVLGKLAKRIGLPAVRTATRQAMKVLGNHFVLGQTIHAALDRAESASGRAYRYSFDMLGEGARTFTDAKRYFDSYATAIDDIGRRAGNMKLPDRPGISVKLSALHPRYDAVNRERVLIELVPQVIELARKAKAYDLNFTIDAEEADRLELSLDVIDAVLADPGLAGWDGFGLAIQAYQKRAAAVIDHMAALAERLDRRLMLRLVKGAYWDTEVKRAQERGLDDYPVFTRKAMTDLNYMACARKLLALRPRIFPQFATHNALTIATITELSGGTGGFEFQRLHGMGDAAHGERLAAHPDVGCRTYAPVGGHRDLLAYLVRRLLENGANSSFVSVAGDPDVPVSDLLRRPATLIGNAEEARNRHIPLPPDLYGPGRRNSHGVELGCRSVLATTLKDIAGHRREVTASTLIDGVAHAGATRTVVSPINGSAIGRVVEADAATADAAVAAALKGFVAWDRTPASERSARLRRAADLLEARQAAFLALLQDEAGKTLDDGISEVREAIDFLRYYAGEAERLCGAGETLPGPTGESNVLRLRGRGVFVAISPWNFPLAIFLGQVSAALAAGNAVVAKPAEQTPLIAFEAVRLLHEAGVPASALHLVTGDGRIGARLVEAPKVAGVVFTGSTEVARIINRTLAGKDGPIVPLIAETGGINAMIVDATALPEQVSDDVVTSAFRSAGQRCSALRILFVQEDVADKMIEMIVGAADALKVGDPRDASVHVGPVIDAEAKGKLEAHIRALTGTARVHYAGTAPTRGTYVAPHVFELKQAADLKDEVFGPVLHVVRFKAGGIDGVLDAIAATSYGLTLGLHTRIDSLVEKVTERLPVGNVYVNRNIIGAVVGVQPFGGHGLSGTGPKAGGPHYLLRFASEQTVTINTSAAGGNAALMTQGE
ncbi:L-proline dehydrogenase /delta-1-pyrroline-5-carboxylate dehydrogenase [Azorhizobium sp. AG788]|uniref:bifunctional proline dehydrogenase/L-glutamate gamma-semialdehyde dehydrogenase PutA n=1 Tax=Azorhizobium sp. AG788 TaxID=2183897 RepID=UPI00106152A2|nr:bifunctional proline dehydrogenase/L-glutamate gamma-semialdehyde dehydrogenase PutA [Azorhizobium sp. AG788]TDT91462.1 L-proline dehydrogenase /delta-1-pyrroline-5-carboxylate dehydrogenase [Azorhizobium sp. AG788]